MVPIQNHEQDKCGPEVSGEYSNVHMGVEGAFLAYRYCEGDSKCGAAGSQYRSSHKKRLAVRDVGASLSYFSAFSTTAKLKIHRV